MNNLFDITDRVVVVTGSTGALAGSAANYLAACGARVAFIGRTQEKLNAALARCTKQTADATQRGELIQQNTPFGRFGNADELHGAIHYLLSDASKFVTGTVLAVDGGFSVFSGV